MKTSHKLIIVFGLLILSIQLMVFGGLLNKMVKGFNDGKMPAKVDFPVPSDYIAYQNDSEVVLPELGDNYNIFNRYWLSLGDFLLVLSIVGVIGALIINLRKSED